MRCMTIPVVAERLGIGERLAARLVATGEIESVKIGSCRRITEEALAKYMGVDYVSPAEQPEWLSVADVNEVIGCTSSHTYGLIAAGLLESRKFGSRRLILVASLDRLLSTPAVVS